MVTRDINLNVSAKIVAFQKEMGKLPAITEKQATKAALKMQSALIKAEVNAAKAATKAGKQAAKGFSDQFAGITLAISLGDIQNAITFAGDLTQKVADLRNQLTDTETRTGIFAETVGGLRLAFDGAGLGADKLESLLLPLPKRFDDVRRGTGEALLGLERLGITSEDLNGPLKDNDAAFKEIVKRLQAVEDPADKAAIAMEVFGEQGTALNAALGTADLEVFIDQAEKFGVGSGPEAAAAAAAWQRSMASLTLVMQGATADVSDLINLGPKVDKFTLGFVFLSETVKAFGDVVGEAVKTNFAILQLALEGNFTAALDLANQVGSTEDAFAEISDRALEATKTFFDNRKAMREGAEAAEKLAEDVNETADALETAEQAAARLAKELRELEKIERARIKAIEGEFKALDQLIKAEAKHADAFVGERDKIDAALAREIVRLEELKIQAGNTAIAQIVFTRAVQAAKAGAALDSAKLDFEDAERQQVLIDEADDRSQEARDKEKEDEEEDAARRADLAFQVIDGFQQVADAAVVITANRIAKTQALLEESLESQLSDIERLRARRAEVGEEEAAVITQQIKDRRNSGKVEREELEKSLKKRRSAAIAAFRASQGAALVDIGLRTALNVVALIAPPPLGLGPLVGPPFALTAGAAGAASVLAQKPPAFHDGTGRDGAGMGPDEFAATLRTGEGVASVRAMQVAGFPELLQAVNRLGDGAMRGGQIVRAVVSQRSMTDAMLREAFGDGDLGALLTNRNPGFSPGLG